MVKQRTNDLALNSFNIPDVPSLLLLDSLAIARGLRPGLPLTISNTASFFSVSCRLDFGFGNMVLCSIHSSKILTAVKKVNPKQQEILEKIADVADNIVQEAWPLEEAFNPTSYEVPGRLLKQIGDLLAELACEDVE